MSFSDPMGLLQGMRQRPAEVMLFEGGGGYPNGGGGGLTLGMIGTGIGAWIGSKITGPMLANSADEPTPPTPMCRPAIPDVPSGNLCEQLALAEAKAGAGSPIMGKMADEPRLIAHYGPGPWIKKAHRHSCPDGRILVIHYFSNGASNVELKFK